MDASPSLPPIVAPGTPPAAVLAALDPARESRAMRRMRGRLLATILRQTFERGRLKMTLFLSMSVLLWAALFWLFLDGFRFLDVTILSPDLYEQTVEMIFSVFFVALMIMLVFSAGVIVYSSLFYGRDVRLLLTLPIRAERVFLIKFQEAILMSSWAFLLLGSPMLLAYGLVAGAMWYYYVIVVPLLLGFIYIPAGIGALLCLAIVRWLPRWRWLVVLAAVVGLLLVAAMVLAPIAFSAERNLMTPTWFQDVLSRLSITQHRLLPSWWLSSGLLEAARDPESRAVARMENPPWAESLMFLVLMISNALFLRQVSAWAAARWYRTAYSRLHGRASPRRRTRAAAIDRLVVRLTPFLSGQVRLFLVKDLRMFRRDPVQWSQFLIFFALLLLYFLNIRRFNYDIYYAAWVNLISFLNVMVVGLLLSTFTTRFVFPMVSLEGRRFWILGLLPLRRDTILWSKFAFAVGACLVPSSCLILLSDVMLRVQPLVAASHQLTCALLCFGLAGISVGLGAKLPSLRETSPSRIAAGFGGTLTLVLSTLYILAIVLLTAVPCHFYLTTRSSHAALSMAYQSGAMKWIEFWFISGTCGSVVLGLVATAAPLVIGLRAFRKVEF